MSHSISMPGTVIHPSEKTHKQNRKPNVGHSGPLPSIAKQLSNKIKRSNLFQSERYVRQGSNIVPGVQRWGSKKQFIESLEQGVRRNFRQNSLNFGQIPANEDEDDEDDEFSDEECLIFNEAEVAEALKRDYNIDVVPNIKGNANYEELSKLHRQ